MDVDLFAYDLPPELIAQQPLARRDQSRLLVYDRQTAVIRDESFFSLPDWLAPGDLLVYNDTRVIPARLPGRKSTGGRVEVFLLTRLEGDGREELWQCLFKASKPLRPGLRLYFSGPLEAEVLVPAGREPGKVRLTSPDGVARAIEAVGEVPLPPYIRRTPDEQDRGRYQTVFSRPEKGGAVAAPTAGLHFTPDLLSRLERAGVARAPLTLHVGLGTFQPVKCRRVEDHPMHAEYYQLPASTLELITRTRAAGGRVVAVGTTVTRALEFWARTGSRSGMCDLFIYPGFTFQVVQALITNFHLPRSTLLMLVAAFAGREEIMTVYRHAIARRYRFYSYGDGMLLL